MRNPCSALSPRLEVVFVILGCDFSVACELVNLNVVEMDSPTLVEISKSKFKLKPGTEWATGYHFVLRIIDDYLS